MFTFTRLTADSRPLFARLHCCCCCCCWLHCGWCFGDDDDADRAESSSFTPSRLSMPRAVTETAPRRGPSSAASSRRSSVACWPSCRCATCMCCSSTAVQSEVRAQQHKLCGAGKSAAGNNNNNSNKINNTACDGTSRARCRLSLSACLGRWTKGRLYGE